MVWVNVKGAMSMAHCDNCRAWSAKVIVVNAGETKQLLCIRCLKILKEMDKEYMNVIGDSVQTPISGHILEKCIE